MDAAVEKLGASHSLSLQAAQNETESDMGKIASHGMRPTPATAAAASQMKLRNATAPATAKSRMYEISQMKALRIALLQCLLHAIHDQLRREQQLLGFVHAKLLRAVDVATGQLL